MITNIDRELTQRLQAKIGADSYPHLLGIDLLEAGQGCVRLRMKIDKRHFNGAGVVHGGVLSSLADTAVAFSLMTLVGTGSWMPTVDLNITYIAPIKKSEIFAEGRIVHRGGTIAVGEVEIAEEGGRLLARSRATYLMPKPPAEGVKNEG